MGDGQEFEMARQAHSDATENRRPARRSHSLWRSGAREIGGAHRVQFCERPFPAGCSSSAHACRPASRKAGASSDHALAS
eukprot:3257084-Pyramimonas_sp.AAC.1